MESERLRPKLTHNRCPICSAVSLTLLLPWAGTRGTERRVPAIGAILAMRGGERDRWHAVRERGMAYMDIYQIRLFSGFLPSLFFSEQISLEHLVWGGAKTYCTKGERKLIAQTVVLVCLRTCLC